MAHGEEETQDTENLEGNDEDDAKVEDTKKIYMFIDNSSDSENSETIDVFETLPSFSFKEETNSISLCEHNLNIENERDIIKRHIETYILIVAALRLIGDHWPYKYVIVGQSPYKSNILPAIATANAYDANRSKSGNFDSQEICKRLSLSYCLLEHSICAINARPYVSEDICINTQPESMISKLRYNMIILTPILYSVKADLHLKIYVTSHPAVTDLCKKMNKLARIELEGKHSLFADSSYRILSQEMQELHTWHNYSTADLMLTGKYNRLKDFTKYLISLSISLPNMAYVKSKGKSNETNSYDVNSYVNSILSKMWQIACDSEKALLVDRENMSMIMKKFSNQSDIDDASEILTRMLEVVRHHETYKLKLELLTMGVVPPLLDTQVQDERQNENNNEKKLLIRKVTNKSKNTQDKYRVDENSLYTSDSILSDNESKTIFSSVNVNTNLKDIDYSLPSVSIAISTSNSTLVQRRARLAILAKNMQNAQSPVNKDVIPELSKSIESITLNESIEKPSDVDTNVNKTHTSNPSSIKRRRYRTVSTSSITSNISTSSRLSTINTNSKTKLKNKKKGNE
ncbi:hypothetical protein HDU92_003088 [Lobulomyces angularis]|nr:hypothetical protein HDU92_003088 [Lobulomyces angularis]